VRIAAEGAEPQRIVYVGDGSWDVRASRELGIGFVGRGGPDRSKRLLELGASAVVPDFADADALIALLSEPRSLVPSAAV
jgi:phosphoglycolate phosphatase-like HAD superfamily hydrolase